VDRSTHGTVPDYSAPNGGRRPAGPQVLAKQA